MWWLGDWLRFGDSMSWGEKYDEAVGELGFGYGTARDAKWVAETFPDLSDRSDKLSWTHHRAVAHSRATKPRRFFDSYRLVCYGSLRNRNETGGKPMPANKLDAIAY